MDSWTTRNQVWWNLERREDSKHQWHSTPYERHRKIRARVDRVIKAFEDSGPMALRMISKRFAGISFETVQDIFIEACKDIALIYGGGVIGGGLIGAGIGSLGAGVGAIPGAAAGGALGFKLATWVTAFLGLKSLVEHFDASLPRALECYKDGFERAWGKDDQWPYAQGPGGWGDDGNAFFGASRMAEGHVELITAMLVALVSYLTRGRGNKAVILQEIRSSSKLGPKVADWVEKYEEQLKRQPGLRPHAHQGGAGVRPAQPAPQTRGGRDGASQQQGKTRALPKPHKMPVPCFKPHNLAKNKYPEFDRQLHGQQEGLNSMTVAEYLESRNAFDGKNSRDPAVAKQARDEYQKKLTRNLVRDLQRNQGMTLPQAKAEAKKQVKQKMDTLAALHNPDLVAGGVDKIGDFGDRSINSRIGRQWKDRVHEIDKLAKEVPESQRHAAMMNVELRRCP